MRHLISHCSLRIWISLVTGMSGLTGCGSFAGNVVPQDAPSMETIYDSVPEAYSRDAVLPQTAAASTEFDPSDRFSAEAPRGFIALPNPALKLTIFPHFAGKDRLPIPRYTTVFHPYAETPYVLRP